MGRRPEWLFIQLGINHIYKEEVGAVWSTVRSRALGDLSSEGTVLLPPLTFPLGLSLLCLSRPGLVWAAQPCRVGWVCRGVVEAGEGARQGQHGVAALGPLSPPSLLARFLSLGLGLQALMRLVGTSWAPGLSLGYGRFGVSVLGGQKRGLRG